MRAAVGRTGSRAGGRFIAALTILAAFGCGRKVMVPPRLDLAPHRPVGLVTFTIENAKGALNVVATERFAADVFAGQSDVELLELGELDDALARIGMDRMDPEAASAIGEAFDVPAVFVGHLIVSDAKPRASLARFPSISATVDVAMTVRLFATASGATIWSNTARTTETIAEVALDSGVPYFSAEDPDEAYGAMVDALAYEVTRDLRPTYVRQE